MSADYFNHAKGMCALVVADLAARIRSSSEPVVLGRVECQDILRAANAWEEAKDRAQALRMGAAK